MSALQQAKALHKLKKVYRRGLLKKTCTAKPTWYGGSRTRSLYYQNSSYDR